LLNSSIPKKIFIEGQAGKLEAVLAEPYIGGLRGIAVIAHPHPLYGGTMDNKVVYTLFKAFLELGFITVKFNFRGVGQSEGDRYSGNGNGTGEIEDVIAVVEAMRHQFAARFDIAPPLLLAGFSFGGAIQAHAARQLRPQKLIMVAPPVERLEVPSVFNPGTESGTENSPHILIIHGEKDDVVPLTTVLDWAAPQDLPVVVVPGAEHFFHGRLHILKRIVLDSCRP
jgi:alpha/beta superfamily hydrolase